MAALFEVSRLVRIICILSYLLYSRLVRIICILSYILDQIKTEKESGLSVEINSVLFMIGSDGSNIVLIL